MTGGVGEQEAVTGGVGEQEAAVRRKWLVTLEGDLPGACGGHAPVLTPPRTLDHNVGS